MVCRHTTTIKKTVTSAAAFSELCEEVLSKGPAYVSQAEMETLLSEVINVARGASPNICCLHVALQLENSSGGSS